MTIDINITSKDRATEVFGLLTSLFNQEYRDFDVYLLDDGSGTPLLSFYFINHIVNRLRLDGHQVIVLRNEHSVGVVRARQMLQDYTLDHGRGEYICRLDDDTVLEPEYLSLLIEVIDRGFDIASGVTPLLGAPLWRREIRFVEPIINRVVLNDEGKFLVNMDDCGHSYLEAKILPAHHFRSNALYKRAVAEKVRYDDIIAPHGFREEEFFSLRAILAGFTIGVHTGATAWHLQTPSGGERRSDAGEWVLSNQKLLNRRVKQWYREHGDFITAYNERLGIKEHHVDKVRYVRKNTNLIITTEE